MNSRRNFIKAAGMGLAAMQLSPRVATALPSNAEAPLLFDFWLWARPKENETDAVLKKTDTRVTVTQVFVESF